MPIAAIEHHVYCARQAALIHVDGLWAENAHTVRGVRGHSRADSAFQRWERGCLVVRAVQLWSENYGLAGRADAVSFDAKGAVRPIEYKIGYRHGEAAELQLCAEAICLEEMLQVDISEGFVWHTATRRRLTVPMVNSLRHRTLEVVSEIRRAIAAGHLPAPIADARCRECQLLDICQPELSTHSQRVVAYMKESLGCDC